MWPLLKTFSWQETVHHPWRTAVAVLAVMLGVALAHAVHLINASALAEFGSATQAVSGRPDAQLRARQGGLPDTLLDRLAAHPGVLAASPLLELGTSALAPGGERVPVRLLGVDALSVGHINPALVARPSDSAGRLDVFAPDAVFLNPAARQRLGDGAILQVQHGLQMQVLRVAGSLAAPGAPLLVMDVAAAQQAFGRLGQLSGIDLRLRAGTDVAALRRELALGDAVLWLTPDAADERLDRLSRAYRVNLTVLALVALFTGAFLVYSVLSLGVAKRQPQFALLGVLGLGAGARQRLVLMESLLLGAVGSLLGLTLAAGLAALALRVLGGDLGGGYFGGGAPALRWTPGAALGYGALGVVAAALGGWWPARAVRRLAPAQALKGLYAEPTRGPRGVWLGLALLVLATAMAWLPPVAGMPLAAYAAVGLLLLGGIAVLPGLARWLLRGLAPWAAGHALPLLALERARRLPDVAAVATGGVVASLALSVALTVMVASFRDSVTQWLNVVLPAPLYVRTAQGAGAGDTVFFEPAAVDAVRRVPGVAAVQGLRVLPLQLDGTRPAVVLIGRVLADPARDLPLLAPPLAAPPGSVPIYVSEALLALYGARPGQAFAPMGQAFASQAPFFVTGVWRDYVRQHGSVVMDLRDLARLTGDERVNDLALFLAPQADSAAVQRALRDDLRPHSGGQDLIEIASAEAIRANSLRIFDRSFAVTYWLQAVAITIGLFGVAASFSAQVLARKREFGLLAHLGLTRAQVLRLVAAEGLLWTALGTATGLALGLGVSLILVHVVNPQSFHWSMDLALPWPRLLVLCAAVVACGTATAWLAARAAASADAVRAVREDW
ncbi:FtsX-like permease family protein [Hydrogenophaga sp. OTU3427]|uniref:FtsX-like permease family protein n=1 Tax=Hydrogenophaga sp. OTU3427 TaxID=3043856 RepID=UPI00313A84EA